LRIDCRVKGSFSASSQAGYSSPDFLTEFSIKEVDLVLFLIKGEPNTCGRTARIVRKMVSTIRNKTVKRILQKKDYIRDRSINDTIAEVCLDRLSL